MYPQLCAHLLGKGKMFSFSQLQGRIQDRQHPAGRGWYNSMHDSASVTNMNGKCSGESGEVLRNKQKMRPPPLPQGLAARNIFKMVIYNVTARISHPSKIYHLSHFCQTFDLQKVLYQQLLKLGEQGGKPRKLKTLKTPVSRYGFDTVTGIRLSDWKRISERFWVLAFLFGERRGGWLEYKKKNML